MTKHLKIMSNDKVVLDDTVESCSICPLYRQCWYRMNDKEYLSSFTFPRIAPTCPLEDVVPSDDLKFSKDKV